MHNWSQYAYFLKSDFKILSVRTRGQLPSHIPSAASEFALATWLALCTTKDLQERQCLRLMNLVPWLHCLQLASQGTELLWLLILYFLEECLAEIDCDQMAFKKGKKIPKLTSQNVRYI